MGQRREDTRSRHHTMPPAAAPPPAFPDVASAKVALMEIIDLIYPAVQPGGELRIALDAANEAAGDDEALKKQQIMRFCMPIIQKMLSAVLVKYKFPPGPMGVLSGFASLSKFSAEDEGIKNTMATLQKAAMGGVMPTPEDVEALKASLA